MNHEKDEQSFLRNLKSKIQEHFKNKSLKTHYFNNFSRTTYNSRIIQGIQGIQQPLATLVGLKLHSTVYIVYITRKLICCRPNVHTMF